MVLLTITFINRKFCIGIWSKEESKFIFTDNALESMASCINQLLIMMDVDMAQVNKVGLLVGPGSFTSIRIAIASILPIQLLYPNKIYLPMKLDEIVYECDGYTNIPIVIKCGHRMYHTYRNGLWSNAKDVTVDKFVTIDEDIKISGNKIVIGNYFLQMNMRKRLDRLDTDRAITPFYGFSLI